MSCEPIQVIREGLHLGKTTHYTVASYSIYPENTLLL